MNRNLFLSKYNSRWVGVSLIFLWVQTSESPFSMATKMVLLMAAFVNLPSRRHPCSALSLYFHCFLLKVVPLTFWLNFLCGFSFFGFFVFWILPFDLNSSHVSALIFLFYFFDSCKGAFNKVNDASGMLTATPEVVLEVVKADGFFCFVLFLIDLFTSVFDKRMGEFG